MKLLSFSFNIFMNINMTSIIKMASVLLLGVVLMTGCDKNGDAPISDNELASTYRETHRLQFHFSPPANWMNDPNGMVYYEGEYHLFYQYYPDSTVWGPMHWGHAVSPDMVYWEHLPIALYPDDLGYIFSGSAVIDWNNTSGFGKEDKPPMVAIFTHHNIEGEKEEGNKTFQYQSLAYSNDKGRTWTKYEDNPVIDNPGVRDFRDPKVSWITDKWVMVFAAGDHIKFYTSANLKDWNHESDWGLGSGAQGRPWECPDFFSMKVEGSDEEKYVLIVSIGKGAYNSGSGTQYFIGDWDGHQFVNSNDSTETKWLDFGKDNYAGVTWADVPEEDGRRLFLGWMSNWQYAQVVPTEKWRSAMTLPRELKLEKTNLGLLVSSYPVKEVEKLDGKYFELPPQVFKENTIINKNPEVQLLKLDLKFKIPEHGIVEIQFSNAQNEFLSVGYSAAEKSYFVDRMFTGKYEFSDMFADYHTSKAPYAKEEVEFLIYLDMSSIELFADGGKCVMTEIFFPSEPFNKVEIITEANYVELVDGRITPLKGIWR
ncbi:MAG: fructan beta-fructosidase [Saprospiraceae bacterium]|jgi:fructan beta-fructosidase